MPNFGKLGVCANCKVQVKAILYRRIIASGADQFVWLCPRCNKFNPFEDRELWIAKVRVKSWLTEEEYNDLPVLMLGQQRCSKCGERGAEEHHWAPRAIFGKDECEQWPTDYLCKSCHDRWHEKVTPQLVKRPLINPEPSDNVPF